jgi:PRTRC genetic system protein B
MEPVSTIVLYANKKNYNSDFYAEYYPVKNRKMQAGKPLSSQDVKTLLMGVNLKYKIKIGFGLLPKRVIHLSFDDGDFSLAWTCSPKKRKMLYSEGRLDKIVRHPRLLFKTNGKDLWIYELKEGTVNNNTKVYEAPYDNLTNGKLCFGDVEVPNIVPDLNTYIKAVEQTFFKGTFTHNRFLNYWKTKDKTEFKYYGTIKEILSSK